MGYVGVDVELRHDGKIGAYAFTNGGQDMSLPIGHTLGHHRAVQLQQHPVDVSCRSDTINKGVDDRVEIGSWQRCTRMSLPE